METTHNGYSSYIADDCVVFTLKLSMLAVRPGRPGPTKQTEQFLFKLLAKRSYTRDTLYYRTTEAFLYQLIRLVVTFKDYFRKIGVSDVLEKRLIERVGMDSDALTLGMRIVACVNCGVPVAELTRDTAKLAQLQNVDGYWDVCPYYSSHDPKSWFGNELLTTAFADAALQYSEPTNRMSTEALITYVQPPALLAKFI